MNLGELLPELLKGLANFTLGNAVMITAALILIYLAVFKRSSLYCYCPSGLMFARKYSAGGMTVVEGMMGVLYKRESKQNCFRC
jgi:Na+-transporting methylmalonyl-CoA/oxaloacetate decarboxylase beta subunit